MLLCKRRNYAGILRKFRFNISAQAITLSGIRAALWLPCETNSIWLLFFPATLCRAVKCTFTMTEPSFRCKLTFLPMYDLALLELKLSIITIPHLGRRFCSSNSGRWAVFRLSLVCRVLCPRSCSFLSRGFYSVPCFSLHVGFVAFLAFKATEEPTISDRGGVTVNKKCL